MAKDGKKKAEAPKKAENVSKWKKKAWDMFSLFIRLRDRIDDDGYTIDYCRCCTCENVKPWKQMQAGHFLPGRKNSNLFREDGCHAQCCACNVCKNGNGVEYYEFMLRKYGPEKIAELKQNNTLSLQFRVDDLKEIYENYKARAAELQRR